MQTHQIYSLWVVVIHSPRFRIIFDNRDNFKMCYTKNLIVDSSDTSFCAKCVNENRVVEIETSKRLSPSLLLLQPSVVSVGIISVFKNEAQVIYEWLLHHAKEGVSQFLLVDNDSTDDYHAQITKFLDTWNGAAASMNRRPCL